MQRHAKIWINSAVISTVIAVSAGCSSPPGPAHTDQPPAPRLAAAAQGAPAWKAVAPQAAQSTAIPGTDPAIQRWFLDNGGAKVAFNDALLRAQRGVAAAKAAECQPLATAARVLSNVLPKLKGLSVAGQKLAAAIQTPVVTFGLAASQCLASDFSTAKATLDLGASQLANAQGTVDGILDGDR